MSSSGRSGTDQTVGAIVVFSDDDAWDYIDSIIPTTGEQFSLWPDKPTQDSEGQGKLRSYHLPGNQATTIWGFPARYEDIH